MIIGAVLLGGAVEALALGFAYARWRSRRSTRPVVGKVVARRGQASGVGRIHAPVADYEIGGETYRFESSVFSTACPKVGEDLALLVDGGDPSKAVLAEGAGTTTFTLILAVLGAVFALAGFFGEALPD